VPASGSRCHHAIRLWLPDRPGALGAVASRIGAVGGDVVGIEIVERESGVAVDELVVELPRAADLVLLVREIGAVDGVRVEQVREVEGIVDGRLEALDAAGQLAEAAPAAVAERLAVILRTTLSADWVAVLGTDPARVVAREGALPDDGWLHAFVAGRLSDERAGAAGGEEIVALPLGRGLAVALARGALPFRPREVEIARRLGRLACARLD